MVLEFMKPILEKMVSAINIYDLPENWTGFDAKKFSHYKNLFDYQQDAIHHAIKALYLFYEQGFDYAGTEGTSENIIRKRQLYDRYNAFDKNIAKLSVKNTKKEGFLYNIFEEYYETDHNKEISFMNFVNRMAFSMSTGSGKSLLIIKVIQLLDYLQKLNEIPKKDILLLAPREDLINQTKKLVDEFNQDPKNPYIELIDLKEYEKVKSEIAFDLGEIKVFYYRSDLISDENTEAYVSFRDYDNDGNWYVLLDEAHKGGKEHSKRQAYYSILSRNGFLFNFSATFTDVSDIATTVKNYDIMQFNEDGYGKNVYISSSEFTSFKTSKNDFPLEEKLKITYKTLTTLTLIKLAAKEVKKINPAFYHSPLLVTLVNSVNKKDADLKIFFKALLHFASEENFDQSIFDLAKEELYQEFTKNKELAVGDGKLKFNLSMIKNITPKHVLREVFNSENFGSIEVIRSNNDKEIAFRLKTSDLTSNPFALIKIGNVHEWEKEMLEGFDFSNAFENRSYFEGLNESGDINILMGSRSFYEGWDSTRPNVINYINIGTSTDAKKFLLQSIGRGIRLEPLPNERKRLLFLMNAGKITTEEYNAMREYVPLLETLFLFSTNKNVLEQIFGLKDDLTKDKPMIIELEKNSAPFPLLIPEYRKKDVHIARMPKFKISTSSLGRLKIYFSSIPIQAVLLQFDLTVSEYQLLKEVILGKEKDIFQMDEGHHYKDLSILVEKLIRHIKYKENFVSGFKEVKDEIEHYKKICVSKNEAEIMKEKVQAVIHSKESGTIDEDELISLLMDGKITKQQFKEKQALIHKGEKKITYKELTLTYIPEHYYIPLIVSDDEKVDYINHIIKNESEVEFIRALENYITSHQDQIKETYDYWMFSKLDETVDNIYIPYYHENKFHKFHPDFIFWFIKDNKYKILFVDPKGMEHTNWTYKVDGFIRLFENKNFQYNGLTISTSLKLFSKDKKPPAMYKDYWASNVDELFI